MGPCPKCGASAYFPSGCVVCGHAPGMPVRTHEAPAPAEPLLLEELRGRMVIGGGLRTDRSRSYAGKTVEHETASGSRQAPGAAVGDTEAEHVARIKEGLARAREAGIPLGRPATAWDAAKAKTLRAQGLSIKNIARRMGVSRSKVQRGLRPDPPQAAPSEGRKEGAVRTCKVPRCTKPVTTAKPSAGYCYGHLRELAPELCPPSMRAKPQAIKRKRGRPARASAPAGKADGCCRSCGAPALPEHQQQIFRELVAEGVGLRRAREIAVRVEKLVERG